jgi:hypothetical protein
MLRLAVAMVVVFVAVPMIVHAASPPAALLGKSVLMTWSEARQQRPVGAPNFRSVNASHNLSMYVSTAGRVFSRQTVRTGLGTGTRDQVSGSPASRVVPSFAGRTMTVISPFRSGGLRRQVIEFDPSFSSCNATVSFEKEPGSAAAIGVSVIDGRIFEIQSVSVANVSCSVRSGNVFGNE